jgi:hypothetical protein
MTLSTKDAEVSERLRQLVGTGFGSRGRFALLERASSIPAGRWKNFYYRKQSASPEMIEFARRQWPESDSWLATGERSPQQAQFPFSAGVPRKLETETVRDRMNWVIREWASPRGENLFEYLAEKSSGSIAPADWAKVVLGVAEPSLEMLTVVCRARPMFANWVLFGYVGSALQVDPTSAESVKAWARKQKTALAGVTAAAKKAK